MRSPATPAASPTPPTASCGTRRRRSGRATWTPRRTSTQTCAPATRAPPRTSSTQPARRSTSSPGTATPGTPTNVKLADQALSSARSTAGTASTIVIALLLTAAVLAAGLAFFIARAITAGVRQMLQAAEGIAESDLEQDVQSSSRDEIGDTARAFERMIAYLQGLAASAGRIAEGDLTVEIEPKSDRDVLGTAFLTMATSLRAIVNDVSAAAQTMSAASQQMC